MNFGESIRDNWKNKFGLGDFHTLGNFHPIGKFEREREREMIFM